MNEHGPRELRIKQYTISPELRETGYSEGQGPCSCTSVCCGHGVFADITEQDRILAHKEIIKKYLDDTQTSDESRWFERNEEEDPDFISGRCVSTEVLNGKCVFLDKSGRCSLQVAATQEGMHKWSIKPLYCILFPLTISANVIGFDDLLNEEQQCCTVSADFTTPLYEACKEELTHLLGEDGYNELATQGKIVRSSTLQPQGT